MIVPSVLLQVNNAEEIQKDSEQRSNVSLIEHMRSEIAPDFKIFVFILTVL